MALSQKNRYVRVLLRDSKKTAVPSFKFAKFGARLRLIMRGYRNN